MGTRHLIAVMVEDEYRIAQYGQWDGYPDGQGVDVLSFLNDKSKTDKLLTSLKSVRLLDDEGRDKEFIESYNKNCPEWSNDPDNRTQDQKDWFSNYADRSLGSKILDNVCESNDKEILLKNGIGFAGDSLFCEYAYVIDFDKGVFEVFQGFNKNEIKEGRFVSGDKSLDTSDGYEPVVMVKSYNLNSLPSEAEFLADLAEEEEE